MRISLNWLREFVDIDPNVDTLAHELTMLGLEIEAIEHLGAGLSHVVVGQIKTIEPHPDADKLVVCTTDVGQEQPLQIVCGATNMRVGDKVPTAVEGSTIAGGFKISRRKMRGVESQGMMCAADELGMGADHSGLLILPPETPVGSDALHLLGLDDTVLEIEITPNRGDWAGMIGVARELAALHQTPLHARPFLRRNDARYQVKGNQALVAGSAAVFGAIHREGDADAAKNHLRFQPPRLHGRVALASQPFGIAFVVRPHVAAAKRKHCVHLIELRHSQALLNTG